MYSLRSDATRSGSFHQTCATYLFCLFDDWFGLMEICWGRFDFHAFIKDIITFFVSVQQTSLRTLLRALASSSLWGGSQEISPSPQLCVQCHWRGVQPPHQKMSGDGNLGPMQPRSCWMPSRACCHQVILLLVPKLRSASAVLSGGGGVPYDPAHKVLLLKRLETEIPPQELCLSMCGPRGRPKPIHCTSDWVSRTSLESSGTLKTNRV